MWKGTYSNIFVSTPTLTSRSSFNSSVIRSPDPVSLRVEEYVKLLDYMVGSGYVPCVFECVLFL